MRQPRAKWERELLAEMIIAYEDQASEACLTRAASSGLFGGMESMKLSTTHQPCELLSLPALRRTTR